MQAVILAGGYGTRISEESVLRPKPMIEIGGKPLLWHIMKLYSTHGIHDFIICCGYKGYLIKEYFANYFLYMSDVTIDMANDDVTIHSKRAEPWRITMVDTGLETMTAGRLLCAKEYIKGQRFCMTYGDGVSDVDITALIANHEKNNKFATVTAVQPPGRFGAINFSGEQVLGFEEKPRGDGAWINGGFFVLEMNVFDFIKDETTVWEHEPLQTLASIEQLMVYRHSGFWSAMDTLRDKNYLETLWESGNAPWKTWQ